MTDLALARDLLLEILSAGPQKGAALATRLRRAFEMRTGREFNLRALGCERFVNFLDRNADVVAVSRPDGQGDIEVTLNKQTGPEEQTGEKTTGPEEQTGEKTTGFPRHRLPTRLWQAFTNPDKNRMRYFNRETGEVAHYLEDSSDRADERARTHVQDWGEAAIPIHPITAERQLGWMLAYLQTHPMLERERQILKHLLQTGYSSQVNVIFTKALGSSSIRWRQTRSRHIFECVNDWLLQHGLQIDDLLQNSQFQTNSTHGHSFAQRQDLHTLIDVLTDDELSSVLIPLDIVSRLLGRTERPQ